MSRKRKKTRSTIYQKKKKKKKALEIRTDGFEKFHCGKENMQSKHIPRRQGQSRGGRGPGDILGDFQTSLETSALWGAARPTW